MLSNKVAQRHPSNELDLLEFEARYTDAELLRRLGNCKALISQQARYIYDEWRDAKRNNETADTLREWMLGRQVAVIGSNEMLQIEYAGQLIDVMPSDLAELVPYGGLGYAFTVTRDNGTVRINDLTDALIHH